MRRRGSIGERSIALFLLGMVAFSPPLLVIFNVEAALFGIPLLYVYLFVAWAVLIALIAWATPAIENGTASDAEGSGRGGGA
jgi:hypothetical protein